MAKRMKKNRIFSALEVANICGVVNQTAINWIKSKYLKAFTTPGGQYRVYADDLVQFLQGRNMRIPDELDQILKSQEGTLNILVIDDDREFNDLLCRKLRRKWPHALVHQAYDGFEAGTMAIKVKPSVVVLDLNLPGVDGVTICRNIKSDPSFNNPQVIVVSGADEDIRDLVLQEGISDYFSKPLEIDDLMEVIENHIGEE